MTDQLPALERRLAVLLGRGTTLASVLIALGLALSPLGGAPHHLPDRLVMTGVAVIVALPVLRVVLMGVGFLRTGDRDFAGAAILVLAIILVAGAIGAAGV